MKSRSSSLAIALVGAVGGLAIAGAATAQPAPPVILKPGFAVAPFSGQAAGMAPLASPKFGVLVHPFQPAQPMVMFVSELNGSDVAAVMPNGQWMPYSVPLFPSGAAGIDIDGPIANSLGATLGLYGGPANLYVAEVNLGGQVFDVLPGGPWLPFTPPNITQPGSAALQIDRTPGFVYGGLMYVSDWGNDASDGILQILPGGIPVMWAPLPNFDPRYMTFDFRGGLTGYGPGNLWVSSYVSGIVASILPNGMLAPPLAVLPPGIEGLSFGLGDGCFGKDLYVANLPMGTIDIVAPNGMVTPFAAGFPGAAYLLFVTQGPFAINNRATLYVLDGNASVWVVTPTPIPCPADLDGSGMVDAADLAILLGAWGPALQCWAC